MWQNWLSNRIFKSFDDIVDYCCYAWNTLTDQPWKIMSIARRDWAAKRPGVGGASGPLKQHRLQMDLVIDQLGAEHKKGFRGSR
jgi:hypothetical protein